MLLKEVASSIVQNTHFRCSGNIMVGRFKSLGVRPRYLFETAAVSLIVDIIIFVAVIDIQEGLLRRANSRC